MISWDEYKEEMGNVSWQGETPSPEVVAAAVSNIQEEVTVTTAPEMPEVVAALADEAPALPEPETQEVTEAVQAIENDTIDNDMSSISEPVQQSPV